MTPEFPKPVPPPQAEVVDDKDALRVQIAAIDAQIAEAEASLDGVRQGELEAQKKTLEAQMEAPAPVTEVVENQEAVVAPDPAQAEQQAAELATAEAADLVATQERLGMTNPQQENSPAPGMSPEDIQTITKRLGDIDGKTRNKEPLTKEELEFLYGGKDVLAGQGKFRNEILKERNDDLFEDMATILGISSRQIEVDPFEIKAFKKTAAYVGAITPDLVRKLNDFPDLRVYEKFPGKQLSTEEIRARASS